MSLEGTDDGNGLGGGEIEIGRRQLEGFVWGDKNGKLKKKGTGLRVSRGNWGKMVKDSMNALQNAF